MAVDHLQEGGRKILYANFENMDNEEELIAQATYVVQSIRSCVGCCFFLANFKGAAISTSFMKHIKNDAKDVLRNSPLVTAVIGVDGLKKILIQGYIRFTGSRLKMFDSKDEALKYLATTPEVMDTVK